MFVFTCCFALALAVDVLGDNCPGKDGKVGGEIYTEGITAQGKIDVIKAHNTYRDRITNGAVPGQPRGKNLKVMSFDDDLSKAGRVVSRTCKMEHIIAKDNRWSWVGQNLFISWSTEKTTNEDWPAAVSSWFNEHRNFTYPTTCDSNAVCGHYTQVVWGNSEKLGCHYIAFYDVNKPSFPHAKLYTCNYGPGGNWNGQAPYELA